MIKLNKKNSLIFAIGLFIAGIICLFLNKTNSLFGALSCIFLAGGFICFGMCSKLRYKNNLIKLDKKLSIMIKDVQLNGEESKYIGLIDENKKILVLADFIKKYKKTYIMFYTCGILFFVCGIVLLINGF